MAQWAFTVGKFFKRGHMEIKIEWRTADRAEALSDGPNMVRLDNLKKLLSDVLAIDKIVRG